MVQGAALALVLGAVAHQARASFNTAPSAPQRTSYQTFQVCGFTPVNSTLNIAYNTGGAHPVTGTMASRVFKSGSTYAYLYQISIGGKVPNAKNLVISYKVTPWATAFTNFTMNTPHVTKSVFQIDQLGPVANTSGFTFFPGGGLKRTDLAQGVDGSFLLADFVANYSTGLRRGTTSTILIAFSKLAPGIGNSHITVAGLGTGSADVPVYVPAPEPSSLMMLALGGAGLVSLPLWRRRRLATS